jgi:hypothetical protein
VQLDERISRLENHFEEPKEHVEPGPPEEFSDDFWWEKQRQTLDGDEAGLERLGEIQAFVEQQIQAFDEGKSWRECARAIEDFLLPERREIDRRRWEERCLSEQGYVPGNNCEDCGRSGARDKPCQHCGGYVSWHGFLHKRVWSIDQLEREIEALHRLAEAGYGGNPARLEGILKRRLAERC